MTDGAGSFDAVAARGREAAVPPDDGRVRLVLVRHGRTGSNVAHRLDTALPGPPLDALGAEQADEVAGLLADWPVRAVYTSRMTRARQTAASIASRHGMDVEELDGVHEIWIGELDQRTDQAAKDTFDDVFRSWWAGDTARPHPGGESADDLRARFLPDVEKIVARVPDGAVVLVSHGAAIRLSVTSLLAGRGPDDWGRDTLVPNTGRVVLRADPDGWTLESWDPMPGS